MDTPFNPFMAIHTVVVIVVLVGRRISNKDRFTVQFISSYDPDQACCVRGWPATKGLLLARDCKDAWYTGREKKKSRPSNAIGDRRNSVYA